jgi:hypothetical protein
MDELSPLDKINIRRTVNHIASKIQQTASAFLTHAEGKDMANVLAQVATAELDTLTQRGVLSGLSNVQCTHATGWFIQDGRRVAAGYKMSDGTDFHIRARFSGCRLARMAVKHGWRHFVIANVKVKPILPVKMVNINIEIKVNESKNG